MAAVGEHSEPMKVSNHVKKDSIASQAKVHEAKKKFRHDLDLSSLIGSVLLTSLLYRVYNSSYILLLQNRLSNRKCRLHL